MLGGSQASNMMNKSKTTVRPNQKRKTLADILSTNKENKQKPEQESYDLSFDKISDDVELIVNEFVGCVGYIYPEGYVTDHGDLEHLVKKDEAVVEEKTIVETPTKQKPMLKVTPAPIMNIDYMQILREIEEKNQQKEAKKLKQKLKREKKKELDDMKLVVLKAKMAKAAARELETIKTVQSSPKAVVEASKIKITQKKAVEELPSTSSQGESPVKKRGRGRPKKTEAEKEETRKKKQIQVQVGDSLMMCDVEDGKEPSSQSNSEESEEEEPEDSEEETQYKPEDVSPLKKKRGRPSKKQVPIQIGDNVMLCDVDEGEQEVAELDEVRAVVNEDQEMEGDGEFEPKVKVEKLDTCEYLEPDCIDCKMCDARFGSAALLRSHVRSEHLGIPLEKDMPLDIPDGIVEEEEEDEDVEYVEEEEEEIIEEEDEELDQEVLKKLMKKQKKEAKKAKKRQRSGEEEEVEPKPKKKRKKSEKVSGKELKKQKLEAARLAAEANGEVIDDVLNSTLEDNMVDGEMPEGSKAQQNKEKKEKRSERVRKARMSETKRYLYPPFTVPEECAKGNAVFDDQGTVKAFICHFCERTIKVNTRGGYLSVYREHIKTHTQEKEFKCPLCEYESHREREVRKHVTRKHDDVDAEEVVPRRSLQARPLSIASGNYVTPLNSITMTQDEIDAQEELFLAKTLEEPLLQRHAEVEEEHEEEGESQEEEGANEEEDEEDELNESIEYPPEGQEFKVEEDGTVVKGEMKGELIEEAMEEEEEEEVPDELPVFYEETGPAVDLSEACGEEEVLAEACGEEEVLAEACEEEAEEAEEAGVEEDAEEAEEAGVEEEAEEAEEEDAEEAEEAGVEEDAEEAEEAGVEEEAEEEEAEEAGVEEDAEEAEEAGVEEGAEESSSQLSSSQFSSSQTTEQIIDSALESMDDESDVVEAGESVQTTEEILDAALDTPAVNGSTESQSVMEVLNLTSKS